MWRCSFVCSVTLCQITLECLYSCPYCNDLFDNLKILSFYSLIGVAVRFFWLWADHFMLDKPNYWLKNYSVLFELLQLLAVARKNGTVSCCCCFGLCIYNNGILVFVYCWVLVFLEKVFMVFLPNWSYRLRFSILLMGNFVLQFLMSLIRLIDLKMIPLLDCIYLQEINWIPHQDPGNVPCLF